MADARREPVDTLKSVKSVESAAPSVMDGGPAGELDAKGKEILSSTPPREKDQPAPVDGGSDKKKRNAFTEELQARVERSRAALCPAFSQ